METLQKKLVLKQGTVVKKSGEKTVRVEVNEYKNHPKYQKRYRQTKYFLVHDESEKANVGDLVVIFPGRPVSKRKSWYLREVVAHKNA